MKNYLSKKIIITSLILSMTLCMSPVTAFAITDEEAELPEVQEVTEEIEAQSEDGAEDYDYDSVYFDEEEEVIDEVVTKPYIAVVNYSGFVETGDYDFKFIYCGADHSRETSVKGITYENNTLTLSGYTGGSLAIKGGEGLENLTINVKTSSTINPGTKSEALSCILAEDIDLNIKGAGKLTLAGKKLYFYSYNEDGTVDKDPYYPDGITVYNGSLSLSNIAIASKYNDFGIYVDGPFLMKGGSFTTTYNKTAALEADSIELYGGTMNSGYAVRDIEPANTPDGKPATWQTLGKSGVSYSESNGYNSYVAKNITVKGGNDTIGTYGNFKWNLTPKGAFSIRGKGYLPMSDDITWKEYESSIKSIELCEGITGAEPGLFDGCVNAKSLSFSSTVAEPTVDNYAKLKSITEFKVNTNNPKMTAVSGVLYSKDKTRLLAYPQAKTTKTFTIPEKVKSVKAGAFYNAKLTTLTLAKTLERIEDRGISNNSITKVTIKSGNQYFSVSNGVLLADKGKTLQWYSPSNSNMSYTIPSTVTKVAAEAFARNNSVRAVYVPESVTKLGSNPFCGKVLYDVFFKGDAPEVSDYNFGRNIIVKADASGYNTSVWKNIVTKCDDFDSYYPSAIHFDETEFELDVANDNAKRANSAKLTVLSDSNNNNIYNYKISTSSSDLSAKLVDGVPAGNSEYGQNNELTVNSVVAGTYKVTVTLPNGVSCSGNVKVYPVFNTDNYVVYNGKSGTNTLVGAKGTIKWSSSDKTIATVSTKGSVTAKKDGTCTIKAVHNGITYEYTVNVTRETPGKQMLYITEYNYKYNRFYVSVKNNGKTNLVVYSSGAVSNDQVNEANNRGLKLTSTSITINPGATKKLTFNVNGSKLSSSYNKNNAVISAKVALNGVKYDAKITSTGVMYYDTKTDEWLDMAGKM